MPGGDGLISAAGNRQRSKGVQESLEHVVRDLSLGLKILFFSYCFRTYMFFREPFGKYFCFDALFFVYGVTSFHCILLLVKIPKINSCLEMMIF